MAVDSGFLTKLPPELRLKVYSFILEPQANAVSFYDGENSYNFQDALILFKLNRQIYHESRKIFRELNTFIKIQTPWPQTVLHVIHRQQVPVVLRGARAETFEGCSLIVSIDAPSYETDSDCSQQFVVHIQDLSKFTKQWWYADLSFNINHSLRVNLELVAPYTPSYEAKHVSKNMQKSLLLPFGMIKRLYGIRVSGNPQPYASIEKEMREIQSSPDKSPEQCLREASKAMADGNIEFQARRWTSALEQYRKAFEAMHIIVSGCERQIYADSYFGRVLREEPYRNKNGQQERLKLRVELVANTCQAYLKLEDYEKCKFWGLRSISMLREATGIQDNEALSPEDEAIAHFPGGVNFGHIYNYTGAACKALGEMPEARRLFLVAREYLDDEKARSLIDKEIEECVT